MHKSLFGFMALLAFALVSCTPTSIEEEVEEGMVKLPISVEGVGNSKTHIESIDAQHASLIFDEGDEIYINDGVFAVNMDGDPYVSANRSDNAIYRAIFPASIVSRSYHENIRDCDTVYITIPKDQTYERSSVINPQTNLPYQKIKAPMISYPSGGSLHFKHICGLLQVTVKNNTNNVLNLSRLKLTSVPVSSSDNASVFFAGDTRVDHGEDNTPVVTVFPPADSTLSGRSVTLWLNGQEARIAKGQERVYYMVVAPFTMDNTQDLTLAAYVASSPDYVGIKVKTGVSLARKQVAKLTVEVK